MSLRQWQYGPSHEPPGRGGGARNTQTTFLATTGGGTLGRPLPFYHSMYENLCFGAASWAEKRPKLLQTVQYCAKIPPTLPKTYPKPARNWGCATKAAVDPRYPAPARSSARGGGPRRTSLNLPPSTVSPTVLQFKIKIKNKLPPGSVPNSAQNYRCP